MTRFGKIFAGLLVLAVIAFASMVRFNPSPSGLPEQEAGPVRKLAIPVAGVGSAMLVDSFGDERGGGERAHHALDIPAPRGTPVVAAAAGTVEKLFDSEQGGHTIYVRTDDPRWVHYYAHLDRVAPGIGEGVRVARGQVIAVVGSSGNADPAAPHLHFEVKRMAPEEKWYQGTGVNPYPLLAAGPPAR